MNTHSHLLDTFILLREISIIKDKIVFGISNDKFTLN